MKTIIFLILALFIQTSIARETTFLWTPVDQSLPHHVICDGQQLNQTGIYDNKFKIDLPVGFDSICYVEVRDGNLSADSKSIRPIVIPLVIYRVASNKSYTDRPAYVLRNGGLINEGARVEVGLPCDHTKVFKTTSSGSWMKAGEKNSEDLYALCKK